MKKIILMMFIIIITFTVFFPCLRNGFVNWDDDVYIIKDTVMQNLSWQNVKTIFTSSQFSNYHPLSRISYALEYHFFKQEPFIYHLNNLILHLFNCMLVFWFILLLSENIFISFVTAILFGIHPLHVESVVWVSERRDVLYSLFFLSALISYLYYLKTEIKKCYYFSLGLFVLSLLSKAMAITLPFILIFIDYFFNNKTGRSSLKNKAPFFIITILLSIVTFTIRIQEGNMLIKNIFNFYHNIIAACFSLSFYLNKMLIPIKLACIYPYHYSDINFFHRISFFSFSPLIILLVCTVILRKYSKKIIFGAIFFIITIFPVIHLIPSSGAISVVSDRYFYIPSIGLFYIFAFVLYRIYTKKHKYERLIKPLIQIILIGIISALSILTYNRCQVWKSSIIFWNDILRKYPNIAIAYNQRGLLFLDNGEYDKAYRDFKNAIEISSKDQYITFKSDKYYYLNLGNCYRAMGRNNDALVTFEQALKLYPNFDEIYFNIANIYDSLGDIDKAILFYKKTLQINPKHVLAHNYLGALFFRLGKSKELRETPLTILQWKWYN